MGKYIILAQQVNVMRIEIEANCVEEAEEIYNETVEDDFERVDSEWSLISIVHEGKEVE